MTSDQNSVLNQILSENTARLPPKLAYFLQKSPALRLGHNRDVMRRHLEGTYTALKLWKQPQYLCNAGALHSVYGAGGQFKFKILSSASLLGGEDADKSDQIKVSASGSADNDDESDFFTETNAAQERKFCRPERGSTLPSGDKETSNLFPEDLIPDASLACHAVSGVSAVSLRLRKLVAGIVGETAERLIFLYSVIDFKVLLEEVHASGTRGFLDTTLLYVKGWRGVLRSSKSDSGDVVDHSEAKRNTGEQDAEENRNRAAREKYKKYYLVRRTDIVSLIIIAMADTLDQANDRCGWCDWLREFDSSEGRWPGASKPPIHLFPQARMAHVLRKYGDLDRGEKIAAGIPARALQNLALPPVFGHCTLSIDLTEVREKAARDLLWELLQLEKDEESRVDAHSIGGISLGGAAPGAMQTRGSSRGPHTHQVLSAIKRLRKDEAPSGVESETSSAYENKLLQVIDLNPFLAEPWLLLGQELYRRGQFPAAFFASGTAIQKFLQMGTAYVKTFSYAGWLAASRTLRAKSRSMMKLQQLRAGGHLPGRQLDVESGEATTGSPIDAATGMPRDEDGLVDLSEFVF
ncbi:unnamed protein product [Amoebophrya sp. A120]|nr:unnamed protein product [Amoebophrya sp. A120]|eukprot:GSA120T00018436001.1